MKRLQSSDGVTIALHELGGSGPPLIICHATGFHGRAYQPLADILGATFTVWALDFRGQGASTPPESGDFAWPAMANDLLVCIDAITSEPILAVGHSLGASAILLAEKARPGTIRGAYLYEPIVFPQALIDARTENPMAGPARNRRAVFPSKRAALERYRSRPPLNELHPASLAAYVEYGFRDTDEGDVELACLPESEARIFEAEDKVTLERLAGLVLPAVVGAGADTGGPSPASLAPGVAAAIEGGRLITYPELGHFGPLQAPDEIALDIVAAFRPRAPFDNPPELRSRYVDPATMHWQPSRFPGIETKVLWSEPETGRSTILFKLAPGAVVPAHEHVDVEQTWVLSGSFEDHEGKALPGHYIWRPAGNRHEARTVDGAVILSMFGAPNRFDDGSGFYTDPRP